MNRYQICDEDKVYAAEFKNNLENGNAYHSPGLQRVLNVMRSGPSRGKYVLVVKEPFGECTLARMPGKRGQPVEILKEHVFDHPDAAEWEVFRLRWRELTGTHLDLAEPVANLVGEQS